MRTGQRIRRGLAILILLVCVGIAVGIFYQTAASAHDREAFTPPGNLFQVDGHALHLYCLGKGSPTILLESGVGGNTLVWAYIQPAVAQTTRVCAYDRAGYGWSEPGLSARTTPQLAQELHSLLNQTDIEPPYILAGHSFGGLVVRTFASLYPDEVVGLVLVDAAHPNQFSPDRCSPACFPASAVNLVDTFYRLLPATARIGGIRLLVPTGLLPLPFFVIPADLPNRDALIASLSSNAHSDTVLAEWRAFPQSAEIVNSSPSLGTLPVRTVTALRTYYEHPLPGQSADETTRIWMTLQSDLLSLSTDTAQVIIDEASHFSLLVEPAHAKSVGEVIVDLWRQVR